MAKKPKVNIKVDSLIEKINDRLKSEYTSVEGRIELSLFMEDILHETDNYRGFQYLYPNELPADVLPGINLVTAYTSVIDLYALRFANTDPTRIRWL